MEIISVTFQVQLSKIYHTGNIYVKGSVVQCSHDRVGGQSRVYNQINLPALRDFFYKKIGGDLYFALNTMFSASLLESQARK